MTDDRVYALVICALLALAAIFNAIALIAGERRYKRFRNLMEQFDAIDRELDQEYAHRRSLR